MYTKWSLKNVIFMKKFGIMSILLYIEMTRRAPIDFNKPLVYSVAAEN